MRKRCKRRVFDLGAHPVRRALLGGAPASSAQLRTVRTQEFMSLHALAGGNATTADAATLDRVVNTAEHLARDGIGPEVLPVIDGIRSAAGQGVNRVDLWCELFDMHDQQRTACSQVEYEAALHAARLAGMARQ